MMCSKVGDKIDADCTQGSISSLEWHNMRTFGYVRAPGRQPSRAKRQQVSDRCNVEKRALTSD